MHKLEVLCLNLKATFLAPQPFFECLKYLENIKFCLLGETHQAEDEIDHY